MRLGLESSVTGSHRQPSPLARDGELHAARRSRGAGAVEYELATNSSTRLPSLFRLYNGSDAFLLPYQPMGKSQRNQHRCEST